MSATWGHHRTATGAALIEDGVAALGCGGRGDLSELSAEPEAFRAAVRAALPEAPERSVADWAGQLHSFVHEARAGDVVVHREGHGGSVCVGEIAGDYLHAAGEALPHRRRVDWAPTRLRRREVSPCALYELGAAQAWFRIERHESVWRATLDAALRTRAF